MSYTAFSAFYDRLMAADFDYGKIADHIENLLDLCGCDAKLVCELACGTGNVTIPLAKRGYDMIAADISPDMLDIARKKAADENLSDILFLNQNMTKIDLYGTVDAFLCMIDGINYCIAPEPLFNMFKKIKTCFLESGGVFIFDISSEYKLRNTVGNNTFVYNGDDIFYTWENRFIEKKRLSDMYLTFFTRAGDGMYKRFAERHLQRAYTAAELTKMLRAAGFEKIAVYDGFSFNSPRPDSERLLFTAQ